MATTFPEIAELERVLDLAAHAPSARNAQPWRWLVDHRRVQLSADWTRRVGDTDADRRDVILSCGAVLHHCAVAFSAAGWSTDIRRFPDDGVIADLEFARQTPRDGSLDLAAAITRRRADRRPYTGSLPAGTIELFVLRAERFGVRLAVVPKVRWAKIGDAEFALCYGDGAPSDATDDAAVLVLATDSDTDLMRLRAGEALSDLTLSAAALGLVTCPLTEPLRDVRNRLALACEVYDGEAQPQVLIRLGVKGFGDPPPPVARRSVAETTAFDLN